MSKLLYIKANAKPEGQSRTFQISDAFIEEYKKNNPEDEIITLDLYKEGIDFLTVEDLQSSFGPKNEDSRHHRTLKYAYQFLEADKFVFAEPMWNLNIPAILKAYFDYICATNVTFKYTADGSVGLCKGKALNITSRGGLYSSGPAAEWEMGDRYLRTILQFLGITDYQGIYVEEVNVKGKDVDAIMDTALEEAIELAKKF